MNVVIVESPAKAKTINKYLGSGYKVLASFGHVRDLPSKDGSVLPDNDFEMLYEVSPDSVKQVNEIAKSVKDADSLLLATDPDREGEAISWHILEILRQKKSLGKNIKIGRVVFNEITKKAVLDGVAHPRDIDMDLVNAQQARRALDYLVGFTLSPILWRKLPGSRSAGRVQSVALRLICERDEEIERFISREYWDISSLFTTTKNEKFKTRLTHLEGIKLEQFSITNQADAERITNLLKTKSYHVIKTEEKQSRRNPYAPFTTSTLQQEASRKLGFSTSRTMSLAQKLYEGVDIGGETTGLITYMRTDGVTVSVEAVAQTRNLIEEKFGKSYVPSSPRMYKTKTKNAQEAHEAIRPTDLTRTPEKMAKFLKDDELKLYDLIWKRMVASQMESVVLDQVAVDIESADKYAILRANGSVIKFDGFYRLYSEGKDETNEEDEEEEGKILPPLKAGDNVNCNEVSPNQHFTQPPPRYSEASLVKKLEELGIGRPSTYSSIISTLINRQYVKLEKRAFFAEERGRIVTTFLMQFFKKYVEYDFTADLEEKLDEVADGEINWKELLKDFWKVFSVTADSVKDLKPQEVVEEIERALEAHIFPVTAENPEPRTCKSCGNGRLSLKLGKFGAFIGCSNYPECRFTRELIPSDEDGTENESQEKYPKELGVDNKSGKQVFVKVGPYGLYVQLGDDVAKDSKEEKPKRSAIPKGVDPTTIDLEKAITLLSLPRTVGTHPETGKEILSGLGRFGPYLLHDGKYSKLDSFEDVLTIGLNRAVDIVAGKKEAAKPKLLATHPETGVAIELMSGRYGPYIKYDGRNYKLPRTLNPGAISEAEAIKIVSESAPTEKSSARADKKSAKKAPAKKETKKTAKEPEEKPSKKKSAAKKPAKSKGKKAA